MPRSSPPTGRGPNVAVISAVVVVVVALVAVVAVRVLSGDDAGGGDGGGDGAAGSEATLSPRCEEIHLGHNTMRWDPTMADEMIECAWPYDPFVSTLEGGEEVAALDEAPFEAHAYDDIWTALGETGLGVCNVSAVADPPADGFAFGFTYGVAEPPCPTGTATAQAEVREFATRPQRDSAAVAAATDAEADVLVLGRWVIAISGDDQSQVDDLVTAMDGLGAVAAAP